MIEYFYLDESPVFKEKYIIRVNYDLISKFFPNGMRGSLNVLIARLLNLSYAQHLRYCRDRLGAELIGKRSRYVVPYFDRNELSRGLVKLLNKRMAYVINEKEFPYEYTEVDGEVQRIPFNNDEDNT